MTRRIYLSPPDISAADLAAVQAAMASGWVAPAGPAIEAFEVALAERCGVPYAVALSSGTAALHLALLLCGVGPGDDVLVPTLTFVAAANAVRYCGARPCFIDSEPRTWNLSSDLLASDLQERKRHGNLPSAVMAVDLYGQCAAYDEIESICDEYGIPLVEDAAEALGATWMGKPAGSFGKFGVLSFNGNKIITTSGGGALLCHDEESASQARYLATQAREPVAHYEHKTLGYNYRLSNVLAALGLSQLQSLDERIEARRRTRTEYEKAFTDIPGIRVVTDDPRGRSNAWLTCLTLDSEATAPGPEDIRVHLESYNIEARRIWKPMHNQPLYAGMPARLGGVADRLYARGLCVPSVFTPPSRSDDVSGHVRRSWGAGRQMVDKSAGRSVKQPKPAPPNQVRTR